MDLGLHGKAALVTGATAGVGLAIARRLADEGAEVTICGRDKSKLGIVAEAIGVRGILTNVTTEEGARKLGQALPKADILVSALNIHEPKAFMNLTDDDWRRTFDLNVTTAMRLVRLYLPHMKQSGWGRVIFVAKDRALELTEEGVHYAMAKSAQRGSARGLAEAFRGTGITVNSVTLGGPFRTFSHDATAPVAEFEEIACLVAYMASPLSLAMREVTSQVSDKGMSTTI